MKILLVNPRMSASSQPPLGLGYLSAYLKANGFKDIDIIDTTWENLDYRLDNITSPPDVAGIQIMTPYFTRSVFVADKIRAKFPEAVLVVGGPHPTADPKQTAKTLKPDFGVVGEGEASFLELIKTIESGGETGQVKGTFNSSGGDFILNPPQPVIDNLDDIPFPDREAFPMDFYLRRGIMQEFGFKALRATTILTSRGCPFKCTYCARFFGRKVRYRGQENVIEEIKLLVNKYNINGLFIVDDTFTVNPRWTKEFCEKLSAEDLKLEIAINSRVDAIDPEFLAILRTAGVRSIAFGVESGNQEILNSLKKGITLEKVEAAVRYTKEAGIRVKGYFMIGSPGETIETMRQSVDFARRLPFDQVQFSITTPYPGTELWDVAADQNLVADFGDALDKGFFESGVMSTGTVSPIEIKQFHEKVCKPLVYRKIATSVIKDWRSMPYFLAYVMRRWLHRRSRAVGNQGSSYAKSA